MTKEGKKRQFYLMMGRAESTTVCGLVGVVLLISQDQFDVLPVWFLCWGLILVFVFNESLLDKGEFAMWSMLRQALGLKTISMKIDALAAHLKVRFSHVPEHYECVPK